MRRLVFLAALVASLATSASNAAAHPGNWYWNRAKAEKQIYVWRHYSYMAKGDLVGDVRCRGYGDHIRTEAGPWFLYKHFNCTLVADAGGGFCADVCFYHVKLHVLGKWRFKTFLVWKQR